MAGGYLIDPTTGQPAIQTASGALLPLGLSHDDLAAAGMPGPAGAPPAPDAGPDTRVALNSSDLAAASRPKLLRQDQAAPMASDGIPRIQLGDPSAPPVWQSESQAAPQQPRIPTREENLADVRRVQGMTSAVDPGELAQHKQVGSSGATRSGGGPDIDPAVRLAMQEELAKGQGGGGPRRLAETGESQKLTTFERPMDPELAGKAVEAQGASDKYQEELAKSLNTRQQQAYEATQAEFAARSGQMAAQQQRFEAQQAELQNYQAKRDALMQEAAQMKTPQMEDYWQSRGTFANVMTGLSIALGGALQGLRGGQNPGLEMSNQAIDRWVASQQEAYRRAEGRVADADNQFAKMVQAFGNENMAADHLREQAWTVRDGMLKSYAEKIGTPSALENFNQAMLQTEAQRAALQAQNSRGAQVEIDRKLSMQGGGMGGKRPGIREAYAAGADVEKNRRIMAGEDKKDGQSKAIEREKVETLTGAMATMDAAQSVIDKVTRLGYADSDADDPRSGAIDYVKNNIPGTETRRLGQDLDQDTFQLARGAQQFLGKSDNDANLAERQAQGLGGSGRERVMGAKRLYDKALSTLQDQLSSMTPEQQSDFLNQLPPERRAKMQSFFNTSTAPAASEQKVR